jgi:MFS family permease
MPTPQGSARATLVAALLGFFVIPLDAAVVNVALPSMDRELHAGVTGLQWIVDGYTLMFAALLLYSGAFLPRWPAGSLLRWRCLSQHASCSRRPEVESLPGPFIELPGNGVQLGL